MKEINNFRYTGREVYPFKVKTIGFLFCAVLLHSQGNAAATVSANAKNSNVLQLAQQQNAISGIVTDKEGMPLPGVNILVEGTKNVVTTDLDGRYSIKAAKGNVLVFSYIGTKSKKVVVTNAVVVNVVLEDDNQLDEVVVVGYGVKKKVNLSGAVAQVGTEYFESRPVLSVGQALQGAIGNLNVTPAGNPGATASFNIRGVNSLSGGEPLVVIDGIAATQNELGRMNPNDIASISVLKDAASASIYGSRASFGVILVTTKNATTDKLKVTINTNTSMRTIGRGPEYEMDPFKVASFKDTMGVPWYDLYSDESLAYAQKVSDGLAPATRIDPAKPELYQYFHQTNWRDILLKKSAFTKTMNMNISQKTESGSFYIGVESVNSEGLYAYNTDILKRYNLRTKGSYKLADWLTLSNNTWIYSNDYDEANATGGDFIREVNTRFTLDPLYNPDGSHTYSYARTIGRLEAGNYDTAENSYQSKFAADMKFFKDKLKLTADASFKRLNRLREAYDTPVTYSDGPGRTLITGSTTPWASFNNWYENTNSYNLYGTFTHTFKKKHYFDFLAGYNQEDYNYNNINGSKTELISTDLPTVNLATGIPVVGQSKSAWAIQGLFYRLNYIFDDKYIFEYNGRYDGSSRFPKKDRWVFNQSASLSWVVSKENFLKDNTFMELLKFRGSYGTLGNQNVGPYPYIANLKSAQTSALIGGKPVTYVSSPGLVSPTLTWETIKTVNGGVDVAFLHNRLTSSFDYYHRYTMDMLTTGKVLPGVLGTGVPTENAADLLTKGWEFELGWRDQFAVAGNDLKYGVKVNLSDSKTIIQKFDNPTGSLGQYYVGQEIGEIWGFVTDGYYQTQEEIDFGPNNTDVASYPSTRPTLPGDNKFTDLNGDGKITFGDRTLANPGDRKIIGNGAAHYNFGVDVNASWKNFDLRAFFQGVGKRDYYPEGWGGSRQYFWSAFATPWGSVTKENYNNHWTPTNRDAFYPRPKSYVAEGPFAEAGLTQTRWLQDASYVRMKNITLGYTLPDETLKKVGVDNLRIYFSGENLFEFTKLFKYLDPENLEGDGYPFQRTFSLGLSLTF